MRRRQFALCSLMVFVTLVCVGLTAWQFLVVPLVIEPQRLHAQQWAAIGAITAKGVDLKVNKADDTYYVFFKNKNVWDGDLEQFLPAFTVPGGWVVGGKPVRRLNLNGSRVSAETVQEFQKISGVKVHMDGDR